MALLYLKTINIPEAVSNHPTIYPVTDKFMPTYLHNDFCWVNIPTTICI